MSFVTPETVFLNDHTSRPPSWNSWRGVALRTFRQLMACLNDGLVSSLLDKSFSFVYRGLFRIFRYNIDILDSLLWSFGSELQRLKFHALLCPSLSLSHLFLSRVLGHITFIILCTHLSLSLSCMWLAKSMALLNSVPKLLLVFIDGSTSLKIKLSE